MMIRKFVVMLFAFLLNVGPVSAQTLSFLISEGPFGKEVAINNPFHGGEICHAPLGYLSDFDNELGQVTLACWANEIPHNASDSEKFAYENQVCQCLKSSKHEAVISMMKTYTIYNETEKVDQEQLLKLDIKLKKLKDKLNDQRNGLAFQASLLSGDSEFIKSYDNTATESIFGIRNTSSKQLNEMKSNALLSIQDPNRPSSTTLENLKSSYNTDVNRLTKLQQSVEKKIDAFIEDRPKLNQDLINNGSAAITGKNQCQSARRYFMVKQYPLKLPTTSPNEQFSEESWNFTKLKQRFKFLVSKKDPSTSKEIEGIKEKLLFLNRNPMIRNFLNSSDNYLGYLERSNLEEADRIEIQKSIDNVLNNGGLNKKKENLVKIIQSLTNTCESGDYNACFGQLSGNKKLDEYNSKLKNFFSDPDIGALTKIEANKDVIDSFYDFKRDFSTPEAPHDSYANFQTHLASSTQVTSIQDSLEYNCRGEIDLDKCVSAYSELCYRLGPVLEKRKQQGLDVNPLFVDDLDQLLSQTFETDIEENKDFKNFNKIHCETPRYKNDKCRKNCYMSFNQWRQKKCANQKENGCDNSAESFEKLYELFEKEYPITKGANRDVQRAMSRVKPPKLSTDIDKELSTGGTSFSDIKKILASKSGALDPNQTETLKSLVPEAPAVSEKTDATPQIADSSINPINSSAMINNPPTENLSSPSNEDRFSDEEKERIKEKAQAEIDKVKEELKAVKDSAEKDKLEQRMKYLEELLAQKTETEDKYKKLLEETDKKLAENFNTQKAPSQTNSSNAVSPDYGPTPGSSDSNDRYHRSPASAPSNEAKTNASTSTPTNLAVPRSASTFAVSSNVASSLSGANSALLDAAIAKGKTSSDGAAIIVQELDRSTQAAVETTLTTNSGQLALTVSPTIYEQIRSENVEVLRKFNEQILKEVEENQTARLVIKNGKESLKVIVINRNGNLVYMPSRVFSLKSLNQHLGPARVPASE